MDSFLRQFFDLPEPTFELILADNQEEVANGELTLMRPVRSHTYCCALEAKDAIFVGVSALPNEAPDGHDPANNISIPGYERIGLMCFDDHTKDTLMIAFDTGAARDLVNALQEAIAIYDERRKTTDRLRRLIDS
jgi:hypothetical protein